MGILVSSNLALAGPLFDPFLERFQVGTYSDPDRITLASGYPMGLLEPIKVDRNWTRAAHQVLRSGGPDRKSPYLSLRLMGYLDDPLSTIKWLKECDYLVSELEATGGADVFSPLWDNSFLGADILAQRAFLALGEGKLSLAAELANRLISPAMETRVSARSVFVWEMRARIFERFSGVSNSSFPSQFWSSMLALGPYDAGNAWALWVAHCRDLEQSILPAELVCSQGEDFLSTLRQGWFSPDVLYTSAFEEPAQSGLGAGLFKDQDLEAHLSRFPVPPREYERQGSWVKGARMASRGQAEAYENLARRTDLSPGWRMDCWRRASELHFLAGGNEAGFRDLEEALKIAADNGGTLSLRRRLRQWSEQAMVLSLARGDTLLARRIHYTAGNSFHEEEGAAFISETSYWLPILRPEDQESGAVSPTALTAVAQCRIEAGQAASLGISNPESRAEFLTAAETCQWEAWIQWGVALAGAKGLSPERQAAADKYRDILGSETTTSVNPKETTGLEAKALACIALRLGSDPAGLTLLEMAMDRDIARATNWKCPVRPSAIPRLVMDLRSSQLDLHALLGFCLASGDMRGMLAVASALPARGLTEEDKLRFLYPLPAKGPILDAIVSQDSEPALILAVARNESLFEPTVRSRAGALGFMQIMPFHYDNRGALPGTANWTCAKVSILKGARILEENRRRYLGDPYLAVAAYNAGPGAASRWGKQLDGHPDRDIYLAWIGYPETRRYVEKVLIDREIYNWIISAERGD
ncbi:MAG: lytic transglycosylase domain-containing protein [Gemmatimonadales bacterium]|nr:lytic transglycosylase domain-containing protein [Gemmatimonadales bacterium]